MDDNVKKIILESTQYVSGSKDDIPDDAFSISASQLGKETLQIYLQMIYGNQEEKEITDSTLGTIFHKGMETIVKEKIIKDDPEKQMLFPETPRHLKMKDNWYLTGTSDLEVIGDNIEIRDYKLTKIYAGKMYRQDPRNHSYGLQASALTYLLSKSNETPYENITNIIDFFYKDANRMKMEQTHDPIIHIPHTKEEIEEVFDKKSKELQHHMENATIPPVCKDLWTRKVAGKTTYVDTKCEFYCNQKNNCPYYKKKQQYKNTSVELIAGW